LVHRLQYTKAKGGCHENQNECEGVRRRKTLDVNQGSLFQAKKDTSRRKEDAMKTKTSVKACGGGGKR
jgi:hypothetical protein